ncbi:MAG: hypothetical protein JST00_14155 [Deltaproteobacteria bacterium]|nr:hypothetical protein [Deltaproteobacteria bacterium]
MATPRRKRSTERIDARGVAPYDVRFRIHRPLVPSGDVDEFLLEIHGEITCVGDGHEEPAGIIDAYVLQVTKAAEARESMAEVCDATSSELEEVYAVLFDESGELKEEISDGGGWGDVLYLHRAEVLPSHRGRGVGLMAALRVIEDFGSGCALAVMKPFPLQLEGAGDQRPRSAADQKYRRSLALDSFDQDPRRARPRLERHWCKLGFERVGDSELFVLDLSMQRPGYRELLGRDARE